jgi:Zn finger protein HypA/HybF involved in hydrogenase expression
VNKNYYNNIINNIAHINRVRSLSNRKGKFWCDFCDEYEVYPGQKCPRCGRKQDKKRLRMYFFYGTKQD